jgi:hypothetical protein
VRERREKPERERSHSGSVFSPKGVKLFQKIVVTELKMHPQMTEMAMISIKRFEAGPLSTSPVFKSNTDP